MTFVEAEEEEVGFTHEWLKREHTALVEIFERSAVVPLDQAARSAYLDQLREHLVRLQTHRALLKTL